MTFKKTMVYGSLGCLTSQCERILDSTTQQNITIFATFHCHGKVQAGSKFHGWILTDVHAN